MTKGDRVEVRVKGRSAWHAGVVKLASANGRSLAVNLDDGSLGTAGILVNTRDQCATVLLLGDGQSFRDVASGERIEIRTEGEG
jgi:hypothetical protein